MTAQLTLLVAADGEAALAQIQQSIPDFIILDVLMPRLDGALPLLASLLLALLFSQTCLPNLVFYLQISLTYGRSPHWSFYHHLSDWIFTPVPGPNAASRERGVNKKKEVL